MEDIVIKKIRLRDLSAVSKMIVDTSSTVSRSNFDDEGVNNFRSVCSRSQILRRLRSGSYGLVALQDNFPIGYIELRDGNHITLYFIAKDYLSKGIGRRLWAEALRHCLNYNPYIDEVTVNSSDYAIPIYTRYGFINAGERNGLNGIWATPMRCRVADAMAYLSARQEQQ